MNWIKEKPYEGDIYQGCLNCPAVEQIASMDMVIAVGFGIAQVTKDDELIYQEKTYPMDLPFSEWNDPTLDKFEEMALKDPDHDWRVLLEAPLRGRTYQRHDIGKWILIESNMGFA
jgi:hypothetical protein